jgi:excisionase family DNA binding protein
MASTTVEPLWDIEDVSKYLRVPVQTLYQWRHRGTGPRAFKVGRHLRYDPAEVRSWLNGQEVRSARR